MGMRSDYSRSHLIEPAAHQRRGCGATIRGNHQDYELQISESTPDPHQHYNQGLHSLRSALQVHHPHQS